MQRQLATIMFADVVGYTRLMGEDEARTLQALTRMRRDLFDPVVTAHHGDIVKRMGDGWIVEFGNVSDAASAAFDVQTRLVAFGRVQLRIGLHMGGFSIQGDDLFGDAINIAARLQALAQPGQVLISDTVHEALEPDIAAQFGGGVERPLKNVSHRFSIWSWPDQMAIRSDVDDLGSFSETEEAASIAVLPFENLSGDPEQEFFSDGISEDLITDLSKVPGLTVIARNSTMGYKGNSVDVRAVARELDVSHLLRGSVRRAGSRVRINVQLVLGEDGAALWADRFDGDLAQIFEVQDEITGQIVSALKLRLTDGQDARRNGTERVDPEAYDALVRGRALIYSFEPDLFLEARTCFETVLAREPRLAAKALAGLSLIESTNFFNGWHGADARSLALSLDYANQAIETDPAEPLAYQARAITRIRLDDEEAGARDADKAIELDPNFAGAIAILGAYKDIEGKHEEAIGLFDRALRLDPKYIIAMQFKARSLLGMGDREAAEAEFRQRLVLSPNYDVNRKFLA
ncbi:MAG: adenylate/guanylate cyclase domain-containing protein, partial [Pseudomonadota bacterium]